MSKLKTARELAIAINDTATMAKEITLIEANRQAVRNDCMERVVKWIDTLHLELSGYKNCLISALQSWRK